MNKKTVLTGVIVSVIMNLLLAAILIGAGVLVLKVPEIFSTVLCAIFALIGIFLTLTTIPNLIGSILSVKQKKGRFDLIFSIVTMVIGVTLATYGIINALLLFDVNDLQMPGIVGTIMTVLRWTICGLTALYLVVLPIIRIVKAEQKFMQLKAELVKMLFGALIVVLLICGLLVSVLNTLIGVSLIVVGALTALCALIILLVGLLGMKKKNQVRGDGNVVAIGVDLDGDGTIDVMHVDTDGDGKVDTVVTKD